MPRAILITQCLQEDFVGPIPAHAPLPNALHIGHAESRRLLGPDPERGPVAQLMAWTRQVAADLAVVHVRDWHDPADARQRSHLERFGGHCLQDTPGARLVLGLDADTDRPGVRIADALTLNDAVDSPLGGWLEEAVATDGAEHLRVAVVGVWTEAKVTFLFYELLSRYGITRLATCSALCASSNRERHFAALDQLRRVLGVHVVDSVGELAAWLLPNAPPLALPAEIDAGRLEVTVAPPLAPEDRRIVTALYPDAASAVLRPIGGGFSGARVFRVDGADALGHAIAPTVLKLGDRGAIAGERRAFESIEGILGNDAPSVRGLVELGPRAGLKYAYAAMGGADVRTFKRLWEDRQAPLGVDRAQEILDAVFGRILGRLTAARRHEPLDFLRAYGFVDAAGRPQHGPAVRRSVDAALSAPGCAWFREGDALVIPDPAGGAPRRLPCPSTLYGPAADDLRRLTANERHPVSYVHGDLNYANILVDGAGNVWVIDYAHAQRTHASRDLHKAESDLLFLLTPLADEAALQGAMAVVDALLAVDDLAAPLSTVPPGDAAPAMARTWALLVFLRRRLAEICGSERNPDHIHLPMLCYSAQTIGYEEAGPLQRRLALYAAARLTDAVLGRVRRDATLRLDAVDPGVVGPGRLSLTLCPGRADRGRDLDTDLASMRAAGAQDVVCLCSQHELEAVGLRGYPERAAEHGLVLRQVPLFDQGAPPPMSVSDLLDFIDARLRAGRHIVVHCMGGLGRTGVIAAALLVRRGLGADEAIEEVRRARSPRAIETAAQEQFVRDLASRRRAPA